jgi:beta-lactamase regulating signal transducer with metallopeptidase domain
MIAPNLSPMMQLFTERLLNTAAAGMLVAGLTWTLLWLIGRKNSGTRFAIWFSALVAIGILPFFSGSGLAGAQARNIGAAGLRGEITLSSEWSSYFFAAWVAVAGLLLLRLVIGVWRVMQVRRNCADADLTAFDPELLQIVRNSRRRARVCSSSEVQTPAAIGFFRPAIVFPKWLLAQLSPEEIKVILLHELAHLSRWDDWTNLAQKIVKAVFFFHPAVWWIENRLTLEREMACDDMVLAQTASPRAYASSLISFAEKLHHARSLTLAQALVSRMRHMSLRVTQILDAKRSLRTELWKPVLGLSAGMLTLVFAAAPYTPKLMVFENQSSQSETQQAMAMESQSRGEDAPIHRASVALEAQTQGPAPQVKAIPASFSMHAAGLRRRSKSAPSRQPLVIKAKAEQEQIPSPPTLVILQTTRFDASGFGVWTVCIWKVGRETIVISSI